MLACCSATRTPCCSAVDATAKDADGRTAAQLAEAKGHTLAAALLNRAARDTAAAP
jgi:ankyrin repeat protein